MKQSHTEARDSGNAGAPVANRRELLAGAALAGLAMPLPAAPSRRRSISTMAPTTRN